MNANGNGRAKDTRQWIRQIEKLPGVSVQRDSSNHYRVSYRGAYVTTVAGTGGQGRGLQNAQARLRRAMRAGSTA